MVLEKTDGEMGNRMVVKIARQISDPNTVVPIDLAAPDSRKGLLRLHVLPRELQLIGGGRRQR